VFYLVASGLDFSLCWMNIDGMQSIYASRMVGENRETDCHSRGGIPASTNSVCMADDAYSSVVRVSALSRLSVDFYSIHNFFIFHVVCFVLSARTNPSIRCTLHFSLLFQQIFVSIGLFI
jgi:hypothetical protein